MPIEVSKTISVHSRKTLLRNRDTLQERHGIKINFPMNLVRGDTQQMILKGGPNAIARAEREIDSILVSWHDEYTAYKRREANRKQERRRRDADYHNPHFPSIPSTTSNTTTRTNKNAFAALERLAQPSPDTNVQVPVTKPKKPALTGWAAMAAKPAEKTLAKPVTNPTKFTFGSVASGAAFTFAEPEPEHFDWAEEAEPSPGAWDSW